MPTMNAKARQKASEFVEDRRVRLLSFDPGPPFRPAAPEADSQCDCACFAVEGAEIPVLDMPLSFYLELTPLCNNRCPGCGNVFVDRASPHAFSPSLSASGWQEVLAQIAPFACQIRVTGGEPTLHPDFGEIMEEISRLGIPFTLFSNARWSDPLGLCRFLTDLKGLNGLLISLHGAEAAAHEAFTGVSGSFAETVRNIRHAVGAGLSVSLSCIITHLNWDRIRDIWGLAQQLGAESVVFNRYIGPDVAGLAASPAELLAALEAISALRASGVPVKMGNCVPHCFAADGQAGCLAGLAFLTIDPWGRVRPCNHAPVICGDLRRRSLAEIWHSPALEAWRDFRPEPCRSCSVFATCRGGCKAQAYSLGLDADPLLDTQAKPLPVPRRQWTFYEKARPVGRFERRSERSGTLLLRGNRLALVHHDQVAVLDMLDGQTTMRQIEQVHGMVGLELVADLYERHLVELC